MKLKPANGYCKVRDNSAENLPQKLRKRQRPNTEVSERIGVVGLKKPCKKKPEAERNKKCHSETHLSHATLRWGSENAARSSRKSTPKHPNAGISAASVPESWHYSHVLSFYSYITSSVKSFRPSSSGRLLQHAGQTVIQLV